MIFLTEEHIGIPQMDKIVKSLKSFQYCMKFITAIHMKCLN